MCGQCCREIYLTEKVHGDINNLDNQGITGGDLRFMKNHWEFIGKGSPPNEESDQREFYRYKCKLITKDNKCSKHHRGKPHVCVGYPWYKHGKQAYFSQPLAYKGCAYERDNYEMRLLRCLYELREKLQQEE